MTRFTVHNSTTGKSMKSFSNFDDAKDYLLGLRNPSNHHIGDLYTAKRIDVPVPNTRRSSNIRRISKSPSDYMDNDDYQYAQSLRGDSNTPMRNKNWNTSRFNKRKSNYNRMWRMKSRNLYTWLRNPKNGTKKERRLANYILSTRRRS